jgi:hypothetical protein
MPADPCSLLFGPARTACQSAQDFAGGASTAVNLATDPLGTIAKGCAEAAAWIIDKLSAAIVTTTTVDFTNPTFIKQYAIVFGASTFLTVVLWLIAVIKSHPRRDGHPRLWEAVGFLWLAVMASAFRHLPLRCWCRSRIPRPMPSPPGLVTAPPSSCPACPMRSRRTPTRSVAGRSC